MKKLLLAGALAFSTFTVADYVMDQPTEVQAKTTVKKITSKDIASYKKGRVIGAKGYLGMSESSLKKQPKVKKDSKGEYIQRFNGADIFYETYKIKPTPDALKQIYSKKVQTMHVYYTHKIDTAALKKYKYKISDVKTGSGVYKVGKTFVGISTENNYGEINLFKTYKDYENYETSRYY